MTNSNVKKIVTDPRKCPAHNMWMRKGQCEICRMAQDQQKALLEQQMGVEKKEVVIKTV